MKSKKTNLHKITLPPMFALLIAVCGIITIPAPIPLTMQTFGLYFTLFAVGGRMGFISVLIYLGLGIMGFPVFAKGLGGFSVLLGPTGGYICGLLIASVIFIFSDLVKPKYRLVFAVIGQISIYVTGTVWYMIIYSEEKLSVFPIIATCVLPFILPDAVKLWLASKLGTHIREIILKNSRSYL